MESEYRLSNDEGRPITYSLVKEQDSQGQQRLIIETEQGEQEFYRVEGRTYAFDSQYNGWVDLGDVSPLEQQQQAGVLPADFSLLQQPAQWLARFGATPTEERVEVVNGRTATRYTLQPIIAEVSQAVEQSAPELPLALTGTMWIDQETKALLQADMTLLDNESGQSLQTYRLTVSEINNIPPISVPTPLVDPVASAAATATAQVWSVMAGAMNYRGTPIEFEVIPLRVRQVAGSSPLSAEVQMIVRQLPDQIFQNGNIEPFLAQLRQQLTLSLPNRNLVVTSSGMRLEESVAEEKTLRVVTTFNANLEDFNSVELILARPGNPELAPVPVE